MSTAALPTVDTDPRLAETRAWVRRAVIGLNLCPFARGVDVKDQIRYVLTEVQDSDALLDVLVTELQWLANTDPQQVETTVLVHPQVLTDFLDFNDFLAVADATVQALGLNGTLQVRRFIRTSSLQAPRPTTSRMPPTSRRIPPCT